MELIIISGPSGSGKTTLSKLILKKTKGGIILNTDNYYKTGLISLILSKTVPCYFDRKISFNYKLFKINIDFILKNGFSNLSYEYNFKNKSIEKTEKITNNIKFVIVEGIFGQQILEFLSIKKCILINLRTKKKSCMKRVIKRDIIERGKSKKNAKKDFLKAWRLYYKNNNKNKKSSRKFLRKFILKKKTKINSLLKKITNIVN